MFFREPHLDVTWLRSIFLVTICTCVNHIKYASNSLDMVKPLSSYIKSRNISKLTTYNNISRNPNRGIYTHTGKHVLPHVWLERRTQVKENPTREDVIS